MNMLNQNVKSKQVDLIRFVRKLLFLFMNVNSEGRLDKQKQQTNFFGKYGLIVMIGYIYFD